jgi:hypothetical protein
MSSIRALKETKFLGNPGTCKTEDREMFEVHFTVPNPMTGYLVPSAV